MLGSVDVCGHHIACLLVHGGDGCTPEFTANFGAVIENINNGAPLRIVRGKDMICNGLRKSAASICKNDRKCLRAKIELADRQALSIVSTLLQKQLLRQGDRLNLNDSRVYWLRACFKQGAFTFCKRCEWYNSRCKNMAQRGFRGAMLFPHIVL